MIGQKTNVAHAGGVERHVGLLADRLAARGHDVTIFVRPRYPTAEPWSHNVRLVSRPCVPTKHLEAITHSAVCVADTIRHPFDVVHFHGVGPSLMLRGARWGRGQRVVVTVHDQDYNKAKWSGAARYVLRAGERQAARQADSVIVVSRYLEHHLRGKYERQAVWIPSGQDPMELVGPGAFLDSIQVPAFGYFLFTARLTPEKGCDTLIRGFRRARTDKHLVVAGGSSYTDSFVDHLRELAAGDPRIHLVGVQTGSSLDELRTNALAYLMPSIQEGLPLSLLESLWYGLPSIVSDIPAVHELDGAVDPDLIRLIPPGDEHALAEAIDRMDAAPPMRQAGSLGWPTWADVAERVEAIYLQVVGQPKRAKARVSSPRASEPV
jgi:glycosyltransferase involved in cell wall biosynthesis